VPIDASSPPLLKKSSNNAAKTSVRTSDSHCIRTLNPSSPGTSSPSSGTSSSTSPFNPPSPGTSSPSSGTNSHSSGISSSGQGLGHTILILDEQLQQIPWESIPCLKAKECSRVPSFALLLHMLTRKKSKDSMYTDKSKDSMYTDKSKDSMYTDNESYKV
jgi:hypothetical protein